MIRWYAAGRWWGSQTWLMKANGADSITQMLMLFAETGFGFCTSEEGSSTALSVHRPEALQSGGLWMRSHVKDGLGLRQTWDLGPYAAVLAHGVLLLQQQNTKKLYGTKNNCVHAQLG